MNVFSQFLIFPLRKFEPFRDYVYYSIVDRDIYFFNKPGENELVVTGLQPYTTTENKFSNLIFPVIFNRDFIQNQALNAGRPFDSNVVYSLSVLNFSRDQYSNTSAKVSASFIDKKGIIRYAGTNKPRFEYSTARVNLLSSTRFIPSMPSYRINRYNDGSIDNINLSLQTISGAGLVGDGSLLPYTRRYYGWEPYCGSLHDLEASADIPDDLKGVVNSSQYFYLSTCNGCGNYDPVSNSRNSPLAVTIHTGSSTIPIIRARDVFFTAKQINDQWARYSITVPFGLWPWRRGAPYEYSYPRSSSLFDSWTTFDVGTNPSPYAVTSDNVPVMKLYLLLNPYAQMGTYSYWRPQLEYGDAATSYQDTGYSVLTGDINTKNLLPPLSTINFTGGVVKWYHWSPTYVKVNTDPSTPFGTNNQDPAYRVQSNYAGGYGLYAEVPIRYPEPPEAYTSNLYRNTDFSGAELGRVWSIDTGGRVTDFTSINGGKGPYFMEIATSRLWNTTISVVSTGKINGCNFVDFRCVRTITDASNSNYSGAIYLRPDYSSRYIKAKVNDMMVASLSCQIIDGQFPGTVGSLTNGKFIKQIQFLGRSGNNYFPGVLAWADKSISSSNFAVLTAVSLSAQATNAGISRVYVEFRTDTIPADSTFDFTIRMCSPKLEKINDVNLTPTPYSPTPTRYHTLSTLTFSCYVRQISGTVPQYSAPSTESGISGLIQRIGFLDQTSIYNNQQITNSMYVKIDGPNISDEAKVVFNLGISDNKSGRYYATKKWQRFSYTNFYNRADSTFDNYPDGRSIPDGRGFQFYINRLDAENATFDPQTTRFYFAGFQSEFGSKPTAFIPTDQAQTGIDNDLDGMLIEPNRSNIAIHSTNFTTTSAAINNVALLPSAIKSPDLSNTLSLLSCADTTSYFFLTGCNDGIAGRRYTISFFIKVPDFGTQIAITQHPQHQGSKISFLYDIGFGRIIGMSKTDTTDILAVESYVNNWKRISYTTLCNSNNGKLWPGFGIATASPLNKFYIWGLQIEEGSAPSSYIPVSGYIATRENDILTLSGINLWTTYDDILPTTNVSVNSSTVYVESKVKYAYNSEQVLLQVEDKKGARYNAITLYTNNQIISSSMFDTGISIKVPTFYLSETLKTAFVFNNSLDYFALASNSISVSSRKTYKLGLSAYYFGSKNYHGYIQKIVIFPEPINMNDIKTITT